MQEEESCPQAYRGDKAYLLGNLGPMCISVTVGQSLRWSLLSACDSYRDLELCDASPIGL